jgi:DNA repair exonuclease SbcCD ATPase subunit
MDESAVSMEDDFSVTTGIDGMIKLVHSRGRIELGEAARLVGVAPSIAEEWARSLEKEGLLRVEYQLTKVFLVWLDVSNADVSARSEKLQEQKSQLSQDVASLIGRARTSGGEMEEIRGELEKLTNAMDDKLPANLRRRLDALHAIDRDKEAIFQQKMKELQEVHTQLETIGREITDKRELVEQLKKRAKEVEDTPELKTRVGEIGQARKQLDETMHTIADMRLSLEGAVGRSTEQKREISKAIDAMAKLESRMDEMLKSKKDAEALVGKLESMVQGLDRDLKGMREMLVTGEVTENMKKLQRERDKIESLEKEINLQNQVLAERTDSIQKALEVHETKYEELLRAKNRLASSVDNYEVELARLDTSFRRSANQMNALSDEMSGVLNSNKKEIESQLEMARKGLEKYEQALGKRQELLEVRDMIANMEQERDRLVKQLRLLSKSMQLLDLQSEMSGKGGSKMKEVEEGVKEAKKSEKNYDSKRDALKEKMREMLKDKERKK